MLGARGGWRALRRCASLPRARREVRLRVREALGTREPVGEVKVQVCESVVGLCLVMTRSGAGVGRPTRLSPALLQGETPEPLQGVLLHSQVAFQAPEPALALRLSSLWLFEQIMELRSYAGHVQGKAVTVMGCDETC